MAKRIVIIGGSLGGATTAARIRRLDHQAEIILIEKGTAIAYAGTIWPGLLLDDSNTPCDLHNLTLDEFQRQYRIDVRLNTEIAAIHRLRRLVEFRQASDQNGPRHREKYDYLVLATGCSAVWPPVFPAGTDGIFTLKSPANILQIRNWLQKPAVRQVLVVGAGPNGVHAASVFSKRGLKVTLLEKANHVLPSLDPEMARIIETHLRQQGVDLLLSRQVTQVSSQNDLLTVVLDNQDKQIFDMIVLACGIQPENSLALRTGLKTTIHGCIQTTSAGQTSDRHIFAVGSNTASFGMISSQPLWSPSPAIVVRQARQTADFLCDIKNPPLGVLGLMQVNLPGIEAASIGANESDLQAIQANFGKTYLIEPASDCEPFIVIKITWSRQNRRILGAQLAGSQPLLEKLSMLASAIQARQTIDDLAHLELPCDIAKPGLRNWFTLIGQIAHNQIEGQFRDCSIYDIASLDTGRVVVVDVRDRESYLRGTIPGAISLPLAELMESLSGKVTCQLPQKPLYLFSETGRESYLAARQLYQAGWHDLYNIAGGYWLYEQVIQRPDQSGRISRI